MEIHSPPGQGGRGGEGKGSQWERQPPTECRGLEGESRNIETQITLLQHTQAGMWEEPVRTQEPRPHHSRELVSLPLSCLTLTCTQTSTSGGSWKVEDAEDWAFIKRNWVNVKSSIVNNTKIYEDNASFTRRKGSPLLFVHLNCDNKLCYPRHCTALSLSFLHN